MTCSLPSRRCKAAFTLLETLVVIAIIAILAVMLLPAVERARGRSKQAACMSNLRQIGVSLYTYRQDHNGIYPTGVPVMEAGVREFFFTPFGALRDNWWDDVYRVFQSLSNHLDNPGVLVCQADKFRKRAESFADLKRENVSYYSVVSRPGLLESPDAIWAGDATYAFTNFNAAARMYGDEAPLAIRTWSGHGGTRGNLLFSDGRVESYGKEGPRQFAQAFVNQDPALGSPPLPPQTPDATADSGGGGGNSGSSGGNAGGGGGGGSGAEASGGSAGSGRSGGSAGGGSSGSGSGNSGGGALALLDRALGGQNAGRGSGGSSRPEFVVTPQGRPMRSGFDAPFTNVASTNLRTLAEIAAQYTNKPAALAITPSPHQEVPTVTETAPAVVPVSRRSWTWLIFLILAAIAAGIALLYRQVRRQPVKRARW